MAQTQLQDSEPSDGLNPTPPQSKRVPLVSKVILKFHHYGGFFIEYSANISQTGMFIRTTQPKPAGSVFIFEIWLGEKYKLVHGLGEVVWAREEAEGSERPPGMGIRYLKLDKDSREVIQRVVSERLQDGGELFDLSERQPDQNHFETTEVGLLAEDAGEGSTDTSELLVIDERDLFETTPVESSESSTGFFSRGSANRRVWLRALVILACMLVGAGALAYFLGGNLLSF